MPRVAASPKTKAKVAPLPTVKRGRPGKPDPTRSAEVANAIVVRATGFPRRPSEAHLSDPDKNPTEQQRVFAREWASGETPVTAAARAGYASGSNIEQRLVKMPHIRALFDAEKAKYEAASGITRKRVMDGLIDAAEMGKLMAEPQAMVAAWREIAKLCGYYEPVTRKVELTVKGKVVAERFQKLSDNQLLELIQSGPAPAELFEPADGDEDDETGG